MPERLLILNPGSTSTKAAVYDGTRPLFSRSIPHSNQDLAPFPTLNDQLDYRVALVRGLLAQERVDLSTLTAVVGRGGILPNIVAGGYQVNDALVDCLLHYPVFEHASNLGGVMALAFARPLVIPAYIYDAVTSDELLEDLRPRERMIILGGGVIGVELACVWAAAGCRVTILEALERILANLDRELSQSLTLQLKRDGVELLTGAHVTRISPGLTVHFTHKGAEQTAQAETVLAAMGRVPATAGLFAGVEPAMERGFLQVNERFQTSIPSLYAIGDAIGGAMLAHKAEAEGCAAADLLLGRAPVRGVSPVPACVYTDPEIAQVGLTADDCKARGIPFAAGKCVMGGNGRTLIAGGKRGFLKLVFHAQTHALLGACLYCCRATDLISELTLAVTLGLTAEQLLRPVRPHPTFSEAVTEAVEAGLAALTR